MDHTGNHHLLANEPQLLHRIGEGDWDAYTQLFQHYLPKLSQYIYPFANESRPDTEEVIQEVFLKIWEKREGLSAIKSFDQYLFRMAKNKVIDLLRQQKSARTLHRQYMKIKEGDVARSDGGILYDEYHDTAKKAIAELSPKLSKVFLMSTQEELSLDEIAAQLHIPKETVKKRLWMAHTSIKNYLRQHAEWLGLLTLLFTRIKW